MNEFKQLRHKLGLSLRQVAVLMEIPEIMTVYRWETGKRAVPVAALSLLRALDNNRPPSIQTVSNMLDGPSRVLLNWSRTNNKPETPHKSALTDGEVRRATS